MINNGQTVVLTNDEYREVLNEISEIYKFNDRNTWITVDECKKLEKRNKLIDVIWFYLWLLEMNENPNKDDRDTLDYIDNFLEEHLVITKT
ncbi:MAG: hypothetical protein IJ341_02010 [Bacteroidales bacterium]|nr:hypothetical protein [Bacteroidales bacterium]